MPHKEYPCCRICKSPFKHELCDKICSMYKRYEEADKQHKADVEFDKYFFDRQTKEMHYQHAHQKRR